MRRVPRRARGAGRARRAKRADSSHLSVVFSSFSEPSLLALLAQIQTLHQKKLLAVSKLWKRKSSFSLGQNQTLQFQLIDSKKKSNCNQQNQPPQV